MEKIILTKQQAERIEERLSFVTRDSLLSYHVESKGKYTKEENKCLELLSVDELAQALYVGYELDETPEEKIAKKYKVFNEYIENSSDKFEYGFCVGIEFCLETLGLKIKGVNE